MSEENQEARVDSGQEGRFAKWERAFQILKWAVEDCQLRDFSEYQEEEFLKTRWQIYKREYPGDVSLIIMTSGLYGTLHWEFFLIKAVVHIIEELDKLLRQPHADKVFGLSEEDNLDEVVSFHARALTSNYIHYLPVVTGQNLNQALDDTMRGYLKNVVEPTLREHWKSLGIPDDFSLLPDGELQKYDRQLEDLRKIYVGEKRPKLTEEQLGRLVEEYQTLRQGYAEARRFHNQTRETFFKSNPAVTDKDAAWRKAWSSMSLDMFPSLRPDCLELLPDLNYQPNELAIRNLARWYRYSEEYMRNLLKSAKRLLRKKGEQSAGES